MNEPTTELQERLTILFRLFGLGAFVFRGVIEHVIASNTEEHIVGRSRVRANLLNAWMREEGFTEGRTPFEAEWLDSKAGSWENDVLIEASWRVESLGVVVWSVNHLDQIPAYDTLFETDPVLEAIPLLQYVEDFLRHTQPRAEEQIRFQRDVAEFWHWRARIYELRQQGIERIENQSLMDKVKELTDIGLEEGALTHSSEGDFFLFGKPYHQLSAEQHQRAFAIARQRHQALNWLCGYSRDWETTPTDT